MYTNRSEIAPGLLPFALALALCCAFALPSTVAGQETTRRSVEEILVTAQKREESLQDVGVSVTAFTGETIGDLGFLNSTDIAAQTPGLNVGTPVGEGNNPSIVLRGVGLNDFNDNNEGPVGIYVDDVYLGALAGQTFQLFDLERVEVLRGPQGTLYGRNTTGGLVHFISKRPTDELDGYADLTIGAYNQIRVEGALGGPVSDTWGARVSVSNNHYDGYVDNRAGPDQNDGDSMAYRGQLLWQPAERFSALLNVHGTDTDVIAPAYQHQATGFRCDASAVAMGLCPRRNQGRIVDFFGYRDRDRDRFAGAYDRNGPLEIETLGTKLDLSWDLDAVSITSITAFEHTQKFHQEDTDMQDTQFFPGLSLVRPTFAADVEQITEELRLSGSGENHRWVAGVYYFDQDTQGALRLDLLGLAAIDYHVRVDQDTESAAVFGQFEFDFGDAWTLLVGARYTSEEKHYEYLSRDFGVTNGAIVFDFRERTVGDLTNIDNDNVSGKLGVNFRPNEDWLLFANVSRGFKSGGFNAGFLENADFNPAAPIPVEGVPFDEETLTAYELGFKSALAGGLVRLNATAFTYDYEDLQALTFQGVSQFIANATDATITGGELELIASPTDSLDLAFGASFLDTEANAVSTPSGILQNRQLVLAPETTFNGLISYEIPLAAGDALTLQADFNYQDEHFFDIANQPVAKEDPYWVWNARIAYQFNDNYEIAFWGKNLSDEEYRVYTFDFTGIFGFNQQFFAPPRWWGVTFSARY